MYLDRGLFIAVTLFGQSEDVGKASTPCDEGGEETFTHNPGAIETTPSHVL